MIRTYSQLKSLTTFEERFEYLSLKGVVGQETFGFERYMNQQFYRSKEWKDIRHVVIARDEGNDLGIPGYEIFDRPIVHHMNPMTPDLIEHGDSDILNPEYLILVTHQTHNAIHYGDASRLARTLVERKPGDTRLW
ncbi:HNH endonuclease [Arthrobacter phage Makai]|nr:HNH endonuclease [Arthrobacter phage Makai]